MKLSVLDQSPISAGSTAAEALAHTVELARAAEALGFHRYWVAEHHGSDGYAGAAPELLVARIASATTSIRVGTGGVMLTHYSPFKLAENFRVLEALFPGRIDVGIGRAPGADALTGAALAYGSPVSPEYFPAKVLDLRAWLTSLPVYTEALAEVRARPEVAGEPPVWILGSSDQSANLAARFGLPFAYAHFIVPDDLVASLAVYRDNFQPSAACPEPRAVVAAGVLCADNSAHLEDLVRCRNLWAQRFRERRSNPGPFPDIEAARAAGVSGTETGAGMLAGTPAALRERLTLLAQQARVEELLLVCITHAFSDRIRAHELLADAFGLAAPAGVTAPAW